MEWGGRGGREGVRQGGKDVVGEETFLPGLPSVNLFITQP